MDKLDETEIQIVLKKIKAADKNIKTLNKKQNDYQDFQKVLQKQKQEISEIQSHIKSKYSNGHSCLITGLEREHENELFMLSVLETKQDDLISSIKKKVLEFEEERKSIKKYIKELNEEIEFIKKKEGK